MHRSVDFTEPSNDFFQFTDTSWNNIRHRNNTAFVTQAENTKKVSWKGRLYKCTHEKTRNINQVYKDPDNLRVPSALRQWRASAMMNQNFQQVPME